MAPRNPDSDVSFDAVEPTPEVAPQIIQAAAAHVKDRPPKQIVWTNVVYYAALHIAAIYGLFCTPWAHPLTWVWTVACHIMAGLGITAGAHRLWSHRSYKAKLPLRILLAVFNSMAMQNHIIEWARDHRVHHKYSETDADPHNAKRGFFFAHVGWLMVRKHPEVKEKGRQINIDDILHDPVCAIQRRMYVPSIIILAILMPTLVPWYFWGETLKYSFFIACILRYTILLNATWMVNSVAHMFGNKPYDRYINPAENAFVTFGAIGEGFHNYHHVFPSDYSTSEYGWRLNITTLFIDFMALIGQVYDRKKMSPEAVLRRKNRTGDGTEDFGLIRSRKTEKQH